MMFECHRGHKFRCRQGCEIICPECSLHYRPEGPHYALREKDQEVLEREIRAQEEAHPHGQ